MYLCMCTRLLTVYTYCACYVCMSVFLPFALHCIVYVCMLAIQCISISNVYMYSYICMYACLLFCMYLYRSPMYVWGMYVCSLFCKYICLNIRLYVCSLFCVYIYLNVRTYVLCHLYQLRLHGECPGARVERSSTHSLEWSSSSPGLDYVRITSGPEYSPSLCCKVNSEPRAAPHGLFTFTLHYYQGIVSKLDHPRPHPAHFLIRQRSQAREPFASLPKWISLLTKTRNHANTRNS